MAVFLVNAAIFVLATLLSAVKLSRFQIQYDPVP